MPVEGDAGRVPAISGRKGCAVPGKALQTARDGAVILIRGGKLEN
jgi:hypothetical protein